MCEIFSDLVLGSEHIFYKCVMIRPSASELALVAEQLQSSLCTLPHLGKHVC